MNRISAGLIVFPVKHRAFCRGFTITELLVSIGVVAVLLGLILPAVARSRESARRIQCQNNLRQIGVAVHSFAEMHGGFPVGDPGGLHGRLLPFVEAEPEAALAAVRNNRGVPIPAYLCPNDPGSAAAATWTIASNYFPSNGVGFMVGGPFNGFRSNGRDDIRPSDITDGLSNTAALSEHLWFDSTDVDEMIDVKNPRVFWWTEHRFYDSKDIALAIDQAMNHRVSPNPQAIHTYYMTYDHMLPPNHRASYNGPDAAGADGDHQLNPASSLHGGFVNTLLADGSCRVTADSIDLKVWHALGTCAGGESVSQ